MMEKRCCFTGHREIDPAEYDEVVVKTRRAIESVIAQGVTTFITGGALGFDTLAAELVLDIRQHNPDVRLILALPCENQTRGWPVEAVERYTAIREAADFVKVLFPKYRRGCMHMRNRYMVNNSAICICYQRKPHGGTGYTVDYALVNHRKLIRV